MSSVFEMFGSLDLDTGKFRSEARAASDEVNKLGATIADTESKAKKFGDGLGKAMKADPAMKAALADIAKMQAQTARGEADLTSLITRQAEQQTRIKIAAFQRQTQAALTELKKQQAAEQKLITRGSGGVGTSFASGLGIPLGAASVGLLAGAAVASGASSSIEAAKDAANSQIQLQSVAKETGITYENLQKQAIEFGNATALSNAKAQSTFAQLVNFANAAGRGDQIELFRKRFADLAAAKGINASQLGDISRQLNQLVDEATDKLLNANPSAFYADFAKSIGKTADSLTDAEKRAAVFDAVIRKGAIFDGSAAARAASLAGEMDGLKKTLDDVSASAGAALGPLAAFLAIATKTAITGSGAEGGGPSPFFLGLANFLRDFSPTNLIPETSTDSFAEPNIKFEEFWKKVQHDFLDGFNKSKGEIAAAAQAPDGNLMNFALSRFLDPNYANMAPVDQAKAKEKALGVAKSYLATQKEIFENVFTRGNLGEIQSQAPIFAKMKNLFTPAEAEKLAKGFSDATEKGFQNSIKRGRPDKNLQDLIKQINGAPSLAAGAKFDLLKTINDDIDQGKEKVKQLGDTYRSTLNDVFAKANTENPFVRLAVEGNSELEKLRKNTQGLSADLRAVFAQKENEVTARNLFKAQLTTGLDVIGLRQRANDLRNPVLSGDKLKAEQERFVAAFRFDNPNFDTVYGANSKEEYDKAISAEEIIRQFAPESLKDPDGERRKRELTEQIDFLSRSGLTDDQRYLADAQLAGLAGRSDATDLNPAYREILASALDRQSSDKANLELKSLEELKDLNTNMGKVEAAIKGLNGTAATGGKAAVEITVKDKTSTGVDVNRLPAASQAAVNALYGTSSSDEGLTSY